MTRKPILVLSHHQSGEGTPLASLWFSQQACRQNGLDLEFAWTARGSDLRNFMKSRRILFDGIYAVRNDWGPIYYRLARLLKKQIAVYWHETEWNINRALSWQPRGRHILYSPGSVRHSMGNRRVAHFHVCSYGLELLQRSYNVAKDRTYLLHNITDSRRLLAYTLPLPRTPGLFVAIGTASERKGTDLFLDIAAKVVAVRPEAKFVWIGGFYSGFSKKELETIVAAKGLTDQVIFTGYQGNPIEIMAQAETILLTSRDDPMPKVLMEGLALGKKCIAFGIGGVSELLGSCGVVIPPGDTAAFAQALHNISGKQDDDQAQHQRRARYLEKYSNEAFGRNFAQAVAWWDGFYS